MPDKYTIKRGSTRPVLQYTLPDAADLRGARAAFIMSSRIDGMPVVNAPAAVSPLSPPIIQYAWQHGDTETAGLYYAEFEVVYASGEVETFPADGYLIVEVKQDLGYGTVLPPLPVINVTGAAVETGVDLASGTAAVAITVAGSAVEAGTDVASGTASVSTPTAAAIQVTGAAVETGADVASGTATVGISVSGAAVETGADVASGTAMVAGTASTVAADLWIGDYDTTSSTMTAARVKGTNVQFVATPTGGGAAVNSPVVPKDTTYNFARANLTDLSPATEYTVQTMVDGFAAGSPGKFRTAAASRQPINLLFGSCNKNDNGIIYETILAQNPDYAAFLHLGDRRYADIATNSEAVYHTNEDKVFAQPRLARLHREKPLVYMWDDHDFGANDSGASSVSRPAALAWYRRRVPARPVSNDATEAVYRAFSPGKGVTVALLDTRADRVTGALINAAQEAWLIALMDTIDTDGLLIINASVPWIGSGNDTWGLASASRKRIADAANAKIPGRWIVIAGDMHALAFDNGSNSPGGAPVYHAAPIDNTNSTKGGPYSGGSPVMASTQQYGRLELTPISGGWDVTFRGYSVDTTTGVQTERLTHTSQRIAGALPPNQVAPSVTAQPTLTGSAVEGGTLTLNPGTASGTPAPTVTAREWLADGVVVAGRTGATFDTTGYVGKAITARVTWSNGVAPDAKATTAAITVTAVTTPPVTGSAKQSMIDFAKTLNPQFILVDRTGTQWTDASGNNRHGLIVGTEGTHMTAGPFGMPFFCGTTTSHAEVAHDDAFNVGSFSVLLWIAPADLTDYQGYYHRAGNEKIGATRAIADVEYRAHSTNSISIYNAAQQNAWSMVAMTYDETTGTANSYSSAGATDGIVAAGTKVATGRQVETSRVAFNGRISGTAIDRRGNTAIAAAMRFGRVLTEDEIRTIYKKAAGLIA